MRTTSPRKYWLNQASVLKSAFWPRILAIAEKLQAGPHAGRELRRTVRYPRLEPRDADCAAKLKDRTLTKLYNERTTKHAWLDFAHKKLDAAVAAAYGFPADLTTNSGKVAGLES